MAITRCCFVFFVALLLLAAMVMGNSNKDSNRADKTDIQKLRHQVRELVDKDWMLTDDFLINFLRARKGNVGKAKEMIEKMVKWRKEYKVDNIHKEDHSPVEGECVKIKHFGRAKRNRHVLVADAGGWNIRKCVLAGRKPMMDRYIVRHILEGPQQIIRESQGSIRDPVTGGNVTQVMVLGNMNGFNLRTGACTGCLGFFYTIATHMELYYPGFMFSCTIRNTPAAWQVVMEFVSPILGTDTSDAIKLMGYDKAQNLKKLLEFIDINELPEGAGGKRKERLSDQKPY